MPELSRPAAPPSCVADYVTATDPSASSEVTERLDPRERTRRAERSVLRFTGGSSLTARAAEGRWATGRAANPRER
jgi:hypothetical protein